MRQTPKSVIISVHARPNKDDLLSVLNESLVACSCNQVAHFHTKLMRQAFAQFHDKCNIMSDVAWQ